jgi:hypothetical protein
MPTFNFKMGRAPVKFHPKTLKLSRFLTPLPAPAAKVYREYKTPPQAMQMLGNDRYGNCTCAAVANKLICDTAHTGTVVIPTEAETLALYSAVTGFDPSDPSTDNGAAMTDVLSYLQSTGFSVGGKVYKILAWARVDFTNLEHRRLGCQMFDGTYVGVNLPASAQSQFIEGTQCNWELDPNSPIAGGHAIFRPGYGAEGDDYVTWANWYVKASAAWSAAYVEEEYVLITEEWFDAATKKTPGGLDLAALEAAIGQL